MTGDRADGVRCFSDSDRASDGVEFDGSRDPLEADRAAGLESDVLDGAGEVHELGGDEDLTRPGASAQPRRHVQCSPSVSVPERHRLPGVDPDPHAERYVCGLIARERLLKIEGRADRFSGGVEDREDLVSSNLDDRSRARFDPLLPDGDESLGERGRRFVASGVAEARVPAQVGDQEGADDGRSRGRGGPSSWLGVRVHRILHPPSDDQVAGLSFPPAVLRTRADLPFKRLPRGRSG